MTEPTREQLIQKANLQADYNEAKARGERWEMQKRPWGCEEWTTMLLGTRPAWRPDYEYRRKSEPPEPPTPIVVSMEGVVDTSSPSLVVARQGRLDLGWIEPFASTLGANRKAYATLTLTIYPDGREVPDTLAEAVKGGER